MENYIYDEATDRYYKIKDNRTKEQKTNDFLDEYNSLKLLHSIFETEDYKEKMKEIEDKLKVLSKDWKTEVT